MQHKLHIQPTTIYSFTNAVLLSMLFTVAGALERAVSLSVNIKVCDWEVSIAFPSFPAAANRIHCSLGIKHLKKKKES